MAPTDGGGGADDFWFPKEEVTFHSSSREACQDDLLQAAVRQQEVGQPTPERPPRWQRGRRGGVKAKRKDGQTARPSGDDCLGPNWLGSEEASTQTGPCKLDVSQPMYVAVRRQSAREGSPRSAATERATRDFEGSPRSATKAWATRDLEASCLETVAESPEWVRVLESCRYPSL